MSAVLDHRARAEFDRLTREEVADAIADMMMMGFSDYGVSAATGLSVEAIRAIIAEHRAR